MFWKTRAKREQEEADHRVRVHEDFRDLVAEVKSALLAAEETSAAAEAAGVPEELCALLPCTKLFLDGVRRRLVWLEECERNDVRSKRPKSFHSHKDGLHNLVYTPHVECAGQFLKDRRKLRSPQSIRTEAHYVRRYINILFTIQHFLQLPEYVEEMSCKWDLSVLRCFRMTWGWWVFSDGLVDVDGFLEAFAWRVDFDSNQLPLR